MNCFDILMLVFTGGIALGTFVLVVFAYKQINQVAKKQQLKGKSEIIEFAKNASEWDFTADDNTYLQSSKQPWIASKVIIMNHINQVTDIMRSGHIISNTLSGAKSAIIKRMVDNLLSELMGLRLSLIELQSKINFIVETTPPEFIKQLDEVGKQKEKVHNAGEILFGEVAKSIGSF